ncbi:aminotransferase [Streptohalobacillus salinus]|uniref:Aminotransferase n=1 Tax=Streptohalobacillus salinus TaxID=621096 RepID=A0A2V3W0L5_9BACI|nr:pyridoxal phosphate-dependent aminotransferase [Streptohalobacillus salinus]PXW87316.1 aminotransferase [Streptohalobacillus salinus]
MVEFQASRTIEQLPTQFFLTLVEKLKTYQAQGYDVINLGQGNPDLPTPQRIVDALKQGVDHPENHKYSPFRGHHDLKEAVSAYYLREYGVTLDPNTEVAILPGTKTGLVELSQCLLNPGDTCLVPDPGYPDYMSGISVQSAHAAYMPLTSDNHFLPDYQAIASDTRNKAKLMFLNYPNNPTAAAATPDFFDETVQFAKANNIAVCHDFAYHTMQFDGEKAPSFLMTEGAKDIGIEMFTLSKAYNMAGWRVGFAVGNPSIIAMLEDIQDHYYVSLFGAIQDAAKEALNGPQTDVEALTAIYETRRNTLISGLRAIGWDVTAPKGTFFCFLKVPDGFDSVSFSDYLLAHAHVFVAPGVGFGPHGEGYVRVALLTNVERLEEACRRLGALDIFKK